MQKHILGKYITKGKYMESKPLKKESFIENLSEITKGMKQKEIASIMGCTEGTMSKYLNPDKKDFPPVDKLYNLSQHFNVSIDWLIGVEKRKETGQNLSAKAICEMLISIYNSVPFDFVEIQKTETCADYFEDSYGNIDIKNILSNIEQTMNKAHHDNPKDNIFRKIVHCNFFTIYIKIH